MANCLAARPILILGRKAVVPRRQGIPLLRASAPSGLSRESPNLPNCDVHRRDPQCPVHVDARSRPMSQMRK